LGITGVCDYVEERGIHHWISDLYPVKTTVRVIKERRDAEVFS
jgi:hypothetical protein